MKKYSSKDILKLAIMAGQEAVRLRKLGLEVKTKPDGSFVTNGDLAADKIVFEGLQEIDPTIEIISEESVKKHPDGVYKNAWVVDPIDGTSAFIKGEKNFGVLIARVENHIPVEGIAYYPEHDLAYYTEGSGAFRRAVHVNEQDIVEMGPEIELVIQPTASTSLRYKQFKTTALDGRLPSDSKEHKYHQAASILAVLEGTLDVAAYIDTMGDWDLAAHDAILRKAGGGVVSASSGQLLEYGASRTSDRAFLQDKSIAGNLEILTRFGLADQRLRTSDPKLG